MRQQTLSEFERLKTALTPFLEANSQASLEERIDDVPQKHDKKGNDLLIRDPWGDKTLEIRIPTGSEEVNLIRALNDIILPPRLSAVFHRSTGLYEIIWTAYKLRAESLEVQDREFTFHFRGEKVECRFGEASGALIQLAKYCFPCSIPNSTDHRNIPSLHLYATIESKSRSSSYGKPISFFINCGEKTEDELIAIVTSLNTFMTYYDHLSPRILIHEDVNIVSHDKRQRYTKGKFPKEIVARDLDQNVMTYWVEMISTRNDIMRFLLCYRIIEYLAFNFLEPQNRAKIKKLLLAPDLYSRLDDVVNAVAETASILKGTEEIPRAQFLVAAAVDLDLVWAEIEKNKTFFSCETVFDGGYTVKNLISKTDSFETWSTNGVRNTLDRLRELRNALAHGQDVKTRATILPTAKNSRLIGPWVNLIEIIAGETMLYRDVS